MGMFTWKFLKNSQLIFLLWKIDWKIRFLPSLAAYIFKNVGDGHGKQ